MLEHFKVFALAIFVVGLRSCSCLISINQREVRESYKLDAVYEMFYRFQDGLRQDELDRYRWVMNYIESGSNVVFIYDPKSRNNLGSQNGCKPGYRSETETIVCRTYRFITMELLSIMGFAFEFTRLDKHKPYPADQCPLPFYYTGFNSKCTVIKEFDKASVTNADTHVMVIPEDPKSDAHVGDYGNLGEYYDGFLLSSCDWYSLLFMFPGRKRVETCNPGEYPDELIPTTQFIEEVGERLATDACKRRPSVFFMQKKCVFRSGLDYPTFPHVRNPLDVIVGTLPKKVISKFCENFRDIDSREIIEGKFDCYEACMERCPTLHKNLPIWHCMKYRYLGCSAGVSKKRRELE